MNNHRPFWFFVVRKAPHGSNVRLFLIRCFLALFFVFCGFSAGSAADFFSACRYFSESLSEMRDECRRSGGLVTTRFIPGGRGNPIETRWRVRIFEAEPKAPFFGACLLREGQEVEIFGIYFSPILGIPIENYKINIVYPNFSMDVSMNSPNSTFRIDLVQTIFESSNLRWMRVPNNDGDRCALSGSYDAQSGSYERQFLYARRRQVRILSQADALIEWCHAPGRMACRQIRYDLNTLSRPIEINNIVHVSDSYSAIIMADGSHILTQTAFGALCSRTSEIIRHSGEHRLSAGICNKYTKNDNN